MVKTTCLGCGREIKNCICSMSPPPWETTTLPAEAITGDMEIENEYNDRLVEIIKQIKNRCDAVLWLLENPDSFYVLPTILEDIYQDAQLIIDEYCIHD